MLSRGPLRVGFCSPAPPAVTSSKRSLPVPSPRPPAGARAKISDQADVTETASFLSWSYLGSLHWLSRSESQMSPDDLPQVTQTQSSLARGGSLPVWGLVTSSSCQVPEYVVRGGQPLPGSENANEFFSQCQYTHGTCP